jgi:isoleucyl-tRNA synthetase
LAALDGATVQRQLADAGTVTVELHDERVALGPEDVLVRAEALPGWSMGSGRHATVAVATPLTAALVEEGLVRELLHHVQAARKSQGLAYDARIVLRVSAAHAVQEILRRWEAMLAEDARVVAFEYDAPVVTGRLLDLGDGELRFEVAPCESA